MEIKFKPLDDNFEHKDSVLSFSESMCKVSEFISLAESVFLDKGLQELNNRLTNYGKGRIPLGKNSSAWLNHGVTSEILIPGTKGWQKGKVRFRVILEFCPDEPEVEETPESNNPEITQPESPLDDIRRMIN